MKYKIEVRDKPKKKRIDILVKCKYHRINKVGISFCKLREKGEQKLKGENVIGTCYSFYNESKLPMNEVFKKDIKRWAVQHLQFENNDGVAKLALDIVRGNIET